MRCSWCARGCKHAHLPQGDTSCLASLHTATGKSPLSGEHAVPTPPGVPPALATFELRVVPRRGNAAPRTSGPQGGSYLPGVTAPRFFPPSPTTPGEQPPTWSQRLDALRYVPPLLRLVFRTHRGYTAAILVLRLVRSFIPLAVLWIGKLIIDGVVAAIAETRTGHPVSWWYLGGLVAIELGIAAVGEALARLSSLLESLLGDLFANRISVRLMQHAATLDLAQFEDADTYDHLERARRQTVGRIGLFPLLLSTAQDLVTLVSLAGVLLVQLPWLLLLLAVAVIPSFLGEAHYAALGYSLLFRWTPERRLLDYLRYMGASDESAKEVKLFGLSDFLVGRYASLSEEFYEENKQLAVRRNVVSSLLV